MQYLISEDDVRFYIRELKSIVQESEAIITVGSKVLFYHPENVSQRKQKLLNGIVIKMSREYSYILINYFFLIFFILLLIN